jgi:hypothetical protein
LALLAIAFFLVAPQQIQPVYGDDPWGWTLSPDGGAYNPTHPLHPIFGDGRPIIDLKPNEVCDRTGKVIPNPHRLTTDFFDPWPSAVSREFFSPPADEYRLIWGIFVDQTSPTGLRGVVGWEHLDRSKALGHPNLMPNHLALAGGNVERKGDAIWFDNKSGRIMTYDNTGFPQLYGSHRLFKDNAQPDLSFIKPKYHRVSGYGRDNFSANPYLPEMCEEATKEAVEVLRNGKPIVRPTQVPQRSDGWMRRVLKGVL